METKTAYAGIIFNDDKAPEFGQTDISKGRRVRQIARGSYDHKEFDGRLTTYIACLRMGWEGVCLESVATLRAQKCDWSAQSCGVRRRCSETEMFQSGGQG